MIYFPYKIQTNHMGKQVCPVDHEGSYEGKQNVLAHLPKQMFLLKTKSYFQNKIIFSYFGFFSKFHTNYRQIVWVNSFAQSTIKGHDSYQGKQNVLRYHKHETDGMKLSESEILQICPPPLSHTRILQALTVKIV